MWPPPLPVQSYVRAIRAVLTIAGDQPRQSDHRSTCNTTCRCCSGIYTRRHQTIHGKNGASIQATASAYDNHTFFCECNLQLPDFHTGVLNSPAKQTITPTCEPFYCNVRNQ